MALAEPLAYACNVKLVLASLARHLRQTLIVFMNHSVADVAVLNAFDFTFNVRFPGEYSRNDVAVLELNYLSDG